MGLVELKRCLRKFERRKLVEKTIVETTEILVPLSHFPCLATIEFNLNYVLCIGPLILILHHTSAWDWQRQWNLEERWSSSIAVFSACFYMFNEAFCRVKDMAKFTLHRYRMLENSLINFDCANLLCECLVTFLHLSNCVRQCFICFNKFPLSFFVDRLSIIVFLLLLALNGLH